MKNLKLAAVCLSCLTMTGCSALNFSVEGLINAPKLTSEQSEIHQALIESVGSNITLKYPKNGEYRSAYVIANIDDEPTDEAMVFYEYTSNGSEEDGLRVNILDKDEKGKWYSVKELAGAGTDIDQVIISPMGYLIVFHVEHRSLCRHRTCIIIGASLNGDKLYITIIVYIQRLQHRISIKRHTLEISVGIAVYLHSLFIISKILISHKNVRLVIAVLSCT